MRHEREQHQFRVTSTGVFSPLRLHHTSQSSFSSSASLSNLSAIQSPNPMSVSPSPQSRDSRSSDQVSTAVPTLNCSGCLRSFTNQRTFDNHQPCRLQFSDENVSEILPILPVTLKPPLNKEETQKVLEMLSPVDRVRLAQLQNWCLEGVYPFVFYGHAPAPIYKHYTAGLKSRKLLKLYLEVNQSITVPKYLIIEDIENNVKSLLSPTQLYPSPSAFIVEETDQTFTIRLNPVHQDDDNDDAIDEDNNVDTDLPANQPDINPVNLSDEDYEISFRPPGLIPSGVLMDDTLPMDSSADDEVTFRPPDLILTGIPLDDTIPMDTSSSGPTPVSTAESPESRPPPVSAAGSPESGPPPVTAAGSPASGPPPVSTAGSSQPPYLPNGIDPGQDGKGKYFYIF